jgi:hypothetical protein
MLTFASCVSNQKKADDKGNIPSLATPKGIDDQWSKWLIGNWQGSAKSDFGPHKDWVKGNCSLNIKLDLNNQFLVRKGTAKVTALSDDYIKQLKSQNLTDSDIEKIRNSTFESIEYYTLDANTGELIGYLFDTLGCIAEGNGKREGNKEIINWTWSAKGKGTSVRITEKISQDKFISTEKYTLPDGATMEDKVEMSRQKAENNNSGK